VIPHSEGPFDVYLEIGVKKTFACAIDWPGWGRSGKNEQMALSALAAYGPRYARVVQPSLPGFQPPADESAFVVVERLPGNATTDFGAPGIAPASDALPVDDSELARLLVLLNACGQAFDVAVRAALGRTLRMGARGGGRDVAGMIRHVVDAQSAYLSQLGWTLKREEGADRIAELPCIFQAMEQALPASAHGELPARGPRGGLRWSARYFVRRSAWHILDHAWEIEDRSG
jgi:hypothetical protein